MRGSATSAGVCAFPQLAQFEFADATFACDYDNFSDTTKIRKAGFLGQVLNFSCPC